ncbi:tetratricopeptide repeat protein [Streptomyces sp. 8L]|uniref:tetratricopeptide repeat protein n=1 Tax=Streptomyces sp. 8L TaxID=2877242 RepID=UPI001CD3FC59|nr:tetratricopeptide repeat protein [Streptomyces sp. 8L]MCA1223410.1 tetratricopeptide repeat protein [Streptomyces sp. 8L]
MDLISITAINAVLGTVGSGMANEAGKWAWETLGGMVRRTLGSETRAPAGGAQTETLAAALYRVLADDPAAAREWSELIQVVRAPEVVFRQPETPPGPRFFMDHEAEMKALDKEARRRYGGTPRVAAVLGAAGMGTTALVQCYAARSAKLFPDGKAYVDLRGGSTATALDPAVALRQLLLEIGVEAPHIPPTPEDRGRLFRRLVADRRLLVVLDHAHSAAQVRRLIVGAPGVLTVIVARGPLPGVDAVPVEVGPLPEKHSRALLAAVVPALALDAAADLVPSVLAECGGSPYALRAAAPRLLAAGRGRRTGPAAPTGADDPVTGAAERAYRALEPAAARAYRLLALRPWPAFGTAMAAHTLQLAEDEIAPLLDALVAAQLLQDPDVGRYRYRPEVRAHAERTAAEEDGIAACSAAVGRSVDWYLSFGVRARKSALKGGWTVGPLYESLSAGPYPDEGRALEALGSELGNLVQAVAAAAEFGRAEAVYQLVQAMWPVQLKAGRHDEVLPALRDGVRIAGLHDPRSRYAGRAHSLLGLDLMELRQYDEAEAQFLAAAAAEEAAGHPRGWASAVESLGLMRLRQWRYQEAYACFERADRILDGIAPGDEGWRDVPRARLLLVRHRGRALSGLGRHEEARELLTGALNGFRGLADAPYDAVDDPYNTARTLCDLAVNEREAGEADTALARLDEAVPLLTAEGATLHLRELARVRALCVSALERGRD